MPRLGSCDNTDNRSEAFTFIELLVVLSIIAILAALLMPGLRDAIESANKVTCANRLKQIHMGATMYTDDSRGYALAFNNKGYWYTKLRLYLGDDFAKYYSWDIPASVKKNPMSHCPSNSLTYSSGLLNFAWNRYAGDFDVINTWGKPYPHKKISCVKRPSEAVYSMDGESHSFYRVNISDPMGSGSTTYNPVFPHDNQTMANILYVDGHIDAKTWEFCTFGKESNGDDWIEYHVEKFYE